VKEIEAEGTRYIYFSRADGIPRPVEMDLQVKRYHPFMTAQLAKAIDFRLVLITLLRPDEAYVHYLYWSDGQDLDRLDVKIEQGAYCDDDFQDAVKTVYQKTTCLNCHRIWDTLVMPSDPYLGAPGLLQAKLVKVGTKIKPCPNCGASLRELVMKIF